MAFVFGLQALQLLDFTKIFQLKGLKLKNKGHTNFYECCYLTEKVYLLTLHNPHQNKDQTVCMIQKKGI